MGSLVACHRKRLIRLVKRILEIELDDEAWFSQPRRLQFACFSGKGGYFLLGLVLNSNGFSPRQRLLGLSHFGSSFSGFRVYGLCVLVCLIEYFLFITIVLFHRKI